MQSSLPSPTRPGFPEHPYRPPSSPTPWHPESIPMGSPGHTPSDIQSHLYRSFLDGKTADVALHIRASWDAVYRLHRVVLIQAGFFRSLFAGGFVESSPKLIGSHFIGPEEVNVTFDDPNITRAGKICIARLYGGGPPLYVDPSRIPTPREPLTPSFLNACPASLPPPGHHPASPRFLLSLLATSVYLSIPSIVTQALMHILNSVGPHSAVRYLNFAIGMGIGEHCDGDPEAAVGLELVGLPVQSISTEAGWAPLCLSRDSDSEDTVSKQEQMNDGSLIQKEDPSNFDAASDVSSTEAADGNAPSYCYGPLSDKIGEAAACWLTRWGSDILSYEESLGRSPGTPPQTSAGPSRRRAAYSPTPGSSASPESMRLVIPATWARGGLSSKWVRAIISSDSFFIKSERERYNLACRAVELRRRSGHREDEESDWQELFAHGIYYIHMSLEDHIRISQDVSPTTGRPYVPLSVLQSAHWGQSLLRHHMMVRPSSGSQNTPPRSPPPRDKELGISVTTSEILASLSLVSQSGEVEDKVYYPVPVDSSSRIGDSSGLENASMEQLFEAPPPMKNDRQMHLSPASSANFFGTLGNRYTAASCVAGDSTGKVRWSPYPPFRFSVEFWGVDMLKEKSRLHSHTVWYAGSLFNVYVQVVRKKGVQLGVYLHRQSSVDPIPPASAPPVVMTQAERNLVARTRGLSLQTESLSFHTSPSVLSIPRPSSRNNASTVSRSTTPVSSPITFNLPPLPAAPFSSVPQPIPAQPYRDPRPSILAHFTILCASATGSSLTRFSSAPDVFSISQSWGWKSSSLRTEEYVEMGDGQEPLVSAAKEVSLRAAVVLGVV